MEDDGELTMNDFKEFSNIYAHEFNRSEMHDRVLVLDVFSDDTEEEIDQVSRGVRQKQESLSDEGVSSSNGETHVTIVDSDASVGKTRPPVGQRKTRKASENVSKRQLKFDLTANQAKATHQHKIFVHSSWLSVHSTYFRGLFYSGLKESNSKDVHLRILQSEKAAHLHLIEAMYNLDVLNPLPVRELVMILVLADKYDTKFVFRKCKYLLKAHVKSTVVCETIFHSVAVKHHMVNVEDLINTIQKFMANKFSPFDEKWDSPSFQNLSEELLTLLLSSDELVVSCEDVVFHALIHWIKNNSKHNLWEMGPQILSNSPLLSVIRFQSLTTSYLLSVVQHHPIAKLMANFNDYYMKAVTSAAMPRDVANNIFLKAEECRLSETMETNDIVNFRWKMPKKEVLKTLNVLHSQRFWACGYETQLSLRRIHNNGDEFCALIKLKILSLKEGGFTSISWQLRYKGKNIFENNYYDHEHIFTIHSEEREKEGSFTWGGSGSCVLELIMKPCRTTVDFCCEEYLF